MFNFYAGAYNNGEVNYNTLNIELKHPLEIANNFLGYNQHSFYGDFATKGVNHNTINIKNDLTTTDLSQSYKDALNIIAARILEGSADYNKVYINNSMSTLPVYIYTAKKNLLKYPLNLLTSISAGKSEITILPTPSLYSNVYLYSIK